MCLWKLQVTGGRMAAISSICSPTHITGIVLDEGPMSIDTVQLVALTGRATCTSVPQATEFGEPFACRECSKGVHKYPSDLVEFAEGGSIDEVPRAPKELACPGAEHITH